MKIRHPALIHAVGWLGAWAVRGWIGTLRHHYRPLGFNAAPSQVKGATERYLCAFWHEYLLLPAYQYAGPDIRVLISQHADGQMIAEICQRLGFGLVRGSTTRGGVEALREMLRASEAFHLAITPDGPRGPRRRVQQGLVYLAAWTGMPIIAMGIGYDRPWRMKSWDRFAVPRPFSRAAWVTGEVLRVPAGATRAEMEQHRLRIEAELERNTTLAERWAETGVWPGERTQGTQTGRTQEAA